MPDFDRRLPDPGHEEPLVAARLMGHTSTRMVETVYARLGVGIQADAIGRLPVSEEE